MNKNLAGCSRYHTGLLEKDIGYVESANDPKRVPIQRWLPFTRRWTDVASKMNQGYEATALALFRLIIHFGSSWEPFLRWGSEVCPDEPSFYRKYWNQILQHPTVGSGYVFRIVLSGKCLHGILGILIVPLRRYLPIAPKWDKGRRPQNDWKVGFQGRRRSEYEWGNIGSVEEKLVTTHSMKLRLSRALLNVPILMSPKQRFQSTFSFFVKWKIEGILLAEFSMDLAKTGSVLA